MKVKFNLSSKFVNPFISINTTEQTSELKDLATSINQLTDQWIINGYDNKKSFALSISTINRFYTESNYVICETEQHQTYKLKERLNFLESHLPKKMFIRTSSSEIIKISQIDHFSLSRAGRYEIQLRDGQTTYASRRYVQKIKEQI